MPKIANCQELVCHLLCLACINGSDDNNSNKHTQALSHIRQALTDDMAKTVAASLIYTRIDYANSLIDGLTNIKKLQRV